MKTAVKTKKAVKKQAKVVKGSLEALQQMAGLFENQKMNLEEIRKQAWR